MCFQTLDRIIFHFVPSIYVHTFSSSENDSPVGSFSLTKFQPKVAPGRRVTARNAQPLYLNLRTKPHRNGDRRRRNKAVVRKAKYRPRRRRKTGLFPSPKNGPDFGLLSPETDSSNCFHGIPILRANCLRCLATTKMRTQCKPRKELEKMPEGR